MDIDQNFENFPVLAPEIVNLDYRTLDAEPETENALAQFCRGPPPLPRAVPPFLGCLSPLANFAPVFPN